MKKYLFLILVAVMIYTQKACLAVDTASTEIDKALKSTAHEPNILSIIFSLLFVIFLIYITGIIYSKLNVVGAKTLREQLKNCNLNRATIVSTTQLGQNKNLHVIELNNKNYLIGATPNSINLIKELGELDKKTQEACEEAEIPAEEQKNSDVYKKYL